MSNIFRKRKKEKERREESKLSEDYLRFLLEEQRQREPKTWYEKFCSYTEILRIPLPRSVEEKLKMDIIFSSLNVTPTSVLSVSIFIGFLMFLFCTVLFLLGIDTTTFLLLLVILPIGSFFYFFTYPSFMAQVMKVQTGDESIKIILYMVIFLKINPSFEGAVNFAAAHTKGPITEDIKKVMWDLEMGRYTTIEQGLSAYMPKWSIWNEEFVRALSLLHGVLVEPTEKGRNRILSKSLNYLLEKTHQKMKGYVEDISSPIMILHIMGLMLPIMGLIMFPMVAIFLHTSVNISQLITGYIVILPMVNFFFINRILMKRPSAFIVPDISRHPELPPQNMFRFNIKQSKIIIPILPFVIIIGLLISSYGILHFIDLTMMWIQHPEKRAEIVKGEMLEIDNPLGGYSLNFKGLAATFSITLGIGITIYLFFHLRSFQRISIRNNIKNIESEFQVGLFSLGNYMGEGYPIEKSLEKSLEEYRKLGLEKRPMYTFFNRILHNMRVFGMTLERSLFDREMGVIRYYPSVLIEEIMKILSKAATKSSVMLGSIAKTIGNYLENIAVIEAKIRELLEDVRSSIRIQTSLVIPMICGIISSLSMFILTMLKVLSDKLAEIEKIIGFTVGASLSSIFDDIVGGFQNLIPMTVMQMIIGVYTVEAVVLFCYLLNGIENGFDSVSRDYTIAQNLIKSLVVYCCASIFSLILFHSLTTFLYME